MSDQDHVGSAPRPRAADAEQAPETTRGESSPEPWLVNRVLRWIVPVDGESHLVGAGPVVNVATRYRRHDQVELWTLERTTPHGIELELNRRVQVVPTGQAFPVTWRPLGSALAADDVLVWHLCEIPDEPSPPDGP